MTNKKRNRKRKRFSCNTTKTYYYPLYNGYAFLLNKNLQHPPLFELQSQAAAWGISRFKRDGLSNIWGANEYPKFLNYVGVIRAREGVVMQGNNLLLRGTNPSTIEMEFFSGVIFYTFNHVERLLKEECGYIKLSEEMFKEVKACFKPLPDYILSAKKCTPSFCR